MMDLAIFAFGTVVTLIVGAAISSLIVWKNKVAETDETDGSPTPPPAVAIERKRA